MKAKKKPLKQLAEIKRLRARIAEHVAEHEISDGLMAADKAEIEQLSKYNKQLHECLANNEKDLRAHIEQMKTWRETARQRWIEIADLRTEIERLQAALEAAAIQFESEGYDIEAKMARDARLRKELK